MIILKLIKQSLIIIAAALFMLLSLPLILIVVLKLDKSYRVSEFFRALYAKVLHIAGLNKLEVIGKDNFDKSETYLIVGNHNGMYDIVNTFTATKSIVGFIAKEELFKIPIFSWWARRFYCLPLNRSNTREAIKVISEAVKNIKAGQTMSILPEGTRSTENTGFNPGSLKIAYRAKAPILPVTHIGTEKIFEHPTSLKRVQTKIVFHKPIYYDEYKHLSTVELSKLIEAQIYETYEELV